MFNVCPGCGQYSVEKDIDPTGPFAVCRVCGHHQPFLRQPLFILTGASGAGKTATCLRLPGLLPECVALETDILWGPAFDRPDTNWREFREAWLRLAKNIGQSGRPVVLGGTALPDQFESCLERRYFSELHYLALVCDGDILAERLRARPDWRANNPEFIDRMVTFNQWLVDNARGTTPPMDLLDTGNVSADETTQSVVSWVRRRLARH
jgi:hypothetical protein